MDATRQSPAPQKTGAKVGPLAILTMALPCLAGVLAWFVPYYSYQIEEITYQLNGWQLLTAAGLEYGGYVVSLPLIARILVAAAFLFAIAGALLVLRGKLWAGAGAFLLSGICPLFLRLSASAMADALAGVGIPNVTGKASAAWYLVVAVGILAMLACLRLQANQTRQSDSLADTSMTDEQLDQKRERRNKGKTAAAMALGLFPLVSFFIPYLVLSFPDHLFSLTAWQLLTAAGLEVNGAVVSIPLLMRIAVVGGVLFSLLGIVLLLCKKQALAGGAFVLSAITPLVVLLTSSSIQTALTGLNISQIVVEYRLPFTLTLVLELLAGVLAVWTKGGEKLAESIFLIFSCVSVGSVLLLTVYMISAGAPAMAEIGLGNFLLGTSWKPGSGQYGILPFILSSIAGTAGAVLVGVPIGILTAVFLSETAPKRLAGAVRPAVQLLAGIPSVVYGFFGMLVILPAIRAIFPGAIGESLLAVILILAIMVLPTIVSVSETALRAVPVSYREAALALGTTPVKTIFKVTVPAAKSGILAGVILGVGRAIGETMAVIMVAGNVANMPTLLGTVKLLTTGIAMEMSYSSGLHRQALFAIGLVLFVFIMIVNVAFTIISKRGVQMDAK